MLRTLGVGAGIQIWALAFAVEGSCLGLALTPRRKCVFVELRLTGGSRSPSLSPSSKDCQGHCPCMTFGT